MKIWDQPDICGSRELPRVGGPGSKAGEGGKACPQGDCDPLRWRPQRSSCVSLRAYHARACPRATPPHTHFLAGLEPHSCLRVAAGVQPLLHPRDTPPQQRTAQHQGLRLHLGSGGDSRGAEVYPGWSGHGGGVRSEAPSKLSGRAVKSHTQPSLDPRGHATLQMRTQILTSTLESTHTSIPPHTRCPSPAAHTHETHTVLPPPQPSAPQATATSFPPNLEMSAVAL